VISSVEEPMPQVSTWSPPVDLSPREKSLVRLLKRTGRFFAFLREVRHRIFDVETQQLLGALYDTETDEGRPPLPAALLATVTLLQAYDQASDAVAVQNAVLDLRWQLVLDCLGAEEAPFSQGALADFRRRLIETDLDRLLIERTVALAKETGLFGDRALRVALDSAPLWGAGRVEDTFNLIGHAMLIVARCAATAGKREVSDVLAEAGVTVVGRRSVKASLDIDWTDDDEKAAAFRRLLQDAERLEKWVEANVRDAAGEPPLREALATLRQVIEQDTEPDPGGSGRRIRRGTASGRRISITDPDMRHGRKSATKVINGYKRHLLADLDTGLIVELDVRPANEPEHKVLDELALPAVAELHIDRGFLGSDRVAELRREGTKVVAKAWNQHLTGKFSKRAFAFDLENRTVTCPNGVTKPMRVGTVRFPKASCSGCPLRARCIAETSQTGRAIEIGPEEDFHESLRALTRTPEGREALRERVVVEHRLAHVCRRQGLRARYRGTRKNLFDLRRISAVENLHVVATALAA
jgi:hypothetical protein